MTRKTIDIHIRFTQVDKARLDLLSERHSMSSSEFIRYILIKEASHENLESTVYNLVQHPEFFR